jgi:hypothetical protein
MRSVQFKNRDTKVASNRYLPTGFKERASNTQPSSVFIPAMA